MISCYVGLGSNIEEPRQQIVKAISELRSLASSRLLCTSSLYLSKPLGPQDQPDFVNAVVELETTLSALDLLSRLQNIESQHKRVRKERWGPRTLDLDLLLYGEEKIEDERLKVPHPEILNRNFVLIPLYEIAPELTIAGMGKIEDLVKRVDQSGLVIISANECHHKFHNE